MDTVLYYICGFGAPIAALLFAFSLSRKINSADPGTERMQAIARQIRKGAMTFLKTEYSILAGFVVIMVIVLAAFIKPGGVQTAVCFLMGALASGIAGWAGMRTATSAAVRTTNAARKGLVEALTIAFSSGAVMGLTVVALGTLGISAVFLIFGGLGEKDTAKQAAEYIFGFSLGASSIALFARVGGGIFTKAADVGADLVGKVEAGIPEDDPRNPAVIADNVGDNVGDVAGMGADLFESYVGCIISAIALSLAMTAGQAGELFGTEGGSFLGEDGLQGSLMLFPIILAGVGILASIVGTFFVKTNDEKHVHGALTKGLLIASLIVVAAGWGLVQWLDIPMQIYYAVIGGLVAGVAIGQLTEYYTSLDRNPVKRIAQQCETGPATTIISGLGTGMVSCALPVIVICITIYLAYGWGDLYGIAIAAVGMLSTLGISLGVDAYGPVADNAGGIAEMSECEPEVRQRTDALDAVGNTTAAMGKGFAIGSAALTAMALFSSFQTRANEAIAEAGGNAVFEPEKYMLILSNTNVIIGLLIGAMLPYLFSAMTMGAVGRAANKMIEEVRRQFRSIPGLMEGNAEPDSETCVAISTRAALIEMILPGVMAVAAPIAVGMLLGTAGLGGLLAGSLVSGVMMAIMMANAGGAWDNAKKYIENGHHGGKGSDSHKAAVIGDTVGDPFKDTSGPSLNILLKLMAVVSVVFVPVIVGIMKSSG
jgi:K(+)-stimulated pyrophosphate-energized sodium pump